jgi:hypothetical protein
MPGVLYSLLPLTLSRASVVGSAAVPLLDRVFQPLNTTSPCQPVSDATAPHLAQAWVRAVRRSIRVPQV